MHSQRSVAAIDCGTNSIRLLVLADGEPPREIDRRLELVRLGQGVDATGEFHPDALARTFAACDTYARLIDAYGCDAVRFVATSAARDARNREEFLSGVRARFGVEAEVISGDEEAQLSFSGAISGVRTSGAVLVVDIGGGSTELVVGDADGAIVRAASLDVGSVRVRERFFAHYPPTPSEITDAQAFIDGLLDASGVDFASIDTAIGVAGTVTSLAAAVLELPVYDRARVHRARLDRPAIERTSVDWLASTLDEMIARPGMHPLRAEVLPAGSLILAAIARRLPCDIIVSETDILDGIARGLLASPGSA